MMTKDVYAACAELEANGALFQKRPDEGKMKGIAFVLDPDGYYVEIIKRASTSTVNNKFTLAQTMFRVKDATKSLHFYRDLLGMTLLHEKHLGVGTDWGFSLYFLAHISEEQQKTLNLPADRTSEESYHVIQHMFGPVVEITHNHGTELKPDFKYCITLLMVFRVNLIICSLFVWIFHVISYIFFT